MPRHPVNQVMATAEGYYSDSDDNLGQDLSDCDQPASSTPADVQNTVVRVCALKYSNVIEYTYTGHLCNQGEAQAGSHPDSR